MAEAMHPVPADFRSDLGPAELAALHEFERSDPDAFWLEQAKRLDWDRNSRRRPAISRSTKTISTSAGSPTGRSTCRSIASTATSRRAASAPR